MSSLSNIKAIKSLNRNNSILVDWNIGTYCNYNCVYCSPEIHNKNINHLTYNQIIDATELLCSCFKDKNLVLSITGGEPTTNPNLLLVCKSLYKKENIRIIITTNGTQSISYYNDILQYVDHITFSQHFHKDQQSKIFLNKLKKINNIYKDKINVQVMCHGELFNNVKKSVEFYKTHNISYTLRRIRPVHIDKTNPNINALQPSTIYNDTYLSWILQESDIYKSTSPTTRIIYKNNNDIVYESINTNKITANKLNSFKDWICYAGVESLIIWPNGDIHRCVHEVGGKLGNILTNTIDDLNIQPIICTSYKCNCVTDINATKAINQKYLDLINKNINK